MLYNTTHIYICAPKHCMNCVYKSTCKILRKFENKIAFSIYISCEYDAYIIYLCYVIAHTYIIHFENIL